MVMLSRPTTTIRIFIILCLQTVRVCPQSSRIRPAWDFAGTMQDASVSKQVLWIQYPCLAVAALSVVRWPLSSISERRVVPREPAIVSCRCRGFERPLNLLLVTSD
ncbi:uncharacterized protein PV06_06572 [Exophiala oligosperma]|uniref:Uncharacterized protein n=1 Tax=Exophiala oligosperma TaxID=215243 RepID=A0A0D2DD70_9EURO|nr:uncharacterized protein PV06_06572 [Exophiala oligosperma]KIW40973.1 hypothetical protein PV06_06572 [Exophiala oligosperma]